MARPEWFVELIKRPFGHRFFLAKLTKLPILGSMVDHALFDGDDIIYLPDDRMIRIDESIDPPEEMALPSQVVEHFIRQASHHWIMDDCLCRDASQCGHYPIDLGCLFLGEATQGINPKLGRRVTMAEALAHTRRCREAGLVHMIGRNKLDTIWLGVGPGDRLLTICNCCPCCCLWKMAPDVAPRIGAKIDRMPGVRVTVTESCTACGACTRDVCFVDAISLSGHRAVVSEECRGCGRCVAACPQQAIELAIEDDRFLENSITRLSTKVDVT